MLQEDRASPDQSTTRGISDPAPLFRGGKRQEAGAKGNPLREAKRPREVPHARLKGAGIVHVKGAFGKFLKHLSPAQTLAQVEPLLPSPGNEAFLEQGLRHVHEERLKEGEGLFRLGKVAAGTP